VSTATDRPVTHAVVVGGGVTGLSAALRLAQAGAQRGVRVTLLEASPRLGGIVRTARPDGLVVEEGPDSFLARKPWARDLCERLGLADELVATPARNRRSFFYHAGRLHPPPAGTVNGVPGRIEPLLRTGLLSPPGKARALLDLVLPRILPASGPDVALGRLLRARLGDEVVDRIAEPMLSGIYAGGADALSLEATFPQLRVWEREHRSLIRAAGRSAGPARAGRTEPAPPPPAAFLTLREGLGSLIDALARALAAAGVDVRTQRPVHTIERAGAGGYVLRVPDEELRADAVIVTAPAPRAAEVLGAVAPDAARELRAVAYADVALVALAYPADAVGHPLVGSGFVVPAREDIAITACTWVSSKWPTAAPSGTVLVRTYLGRAGTGILEHDDDALVAMSRQALRRSMGIAAEPRMVHVVRTPAGLPQYAVGHLARLERVEAGLAHLPGLLVTGAAFRGVGLPDCIRQGEVAADSILAAAAAAG